MATPEEVAIPKPVAVRPKPLRSAKKLNILGVKCYLKILRAPRFKKPWTLMGLLPWDREVEHLAGLRPAQRGVVSTFINVASKTAGLALADRMAIIASIMKGMKFGGRARKAPAARLSPEQLKAKIAEIKTALGLT
jgi:hypothetical protein